MSYPVKYLKLYETDWLKLCTHGSHMINLYDGDPFFFSTTLRLPLLGLERNILSIIEWMAMKFGTNIHVPLGRNCNDLVSLNLHLL